MCVYLDGVFKLGWFAPKISGIMPGYITGLAQGALIPGDLLNIFILNWRQAVKPTQSQEGFEAQREHRAFSMSVDLLTCS